MRVGGKQGFGRPPQELRGQSWWIKLQFLAERHLARGAMDANPKADYQGAGVLDTTHRFTAWSLISNVTFQLDRRRHDVELIYMIGGEIHMKQTAVASETCCLFVSCKWQQCPTTAEVLIEPLMWTIWTPWLVNELFPHSKKVRKLLRSCEPVWDMWRTARFRSTNAWWDSFCALYGAPLNSN